MAESKVDEDEFYKNHHDRINARENIHNGDYDENEPFSVFVSKREYEEYKQIENLLKIYFDTNFWIFLRDVELGRPRSNNDVLLYNNVLSLVENKKIICPICDTLLFELLKQNVAETRVSMARLIDKLCGGTIIKPFFDRYYLEFYHFLKIASKGIEPPALPAKPYIWTKIPYIIGLFSFNSKKIDSKSHNLVNKSLYDFFSKMHLEEFLDMLDLSNTPDSKWQWNDITSENNLGKRNVITSSFNELHSNKIAGILEIIGGKLSEVIILVMKQLFPDKIPQHIDQKDKESLISTAQKIVYNCFKYKRSKMALCLPTYHIIASLHAAVNKDKNRKYKPNDYFDFKHASAAIPYCDIFATDTQLATLLKSGNLSFEDKYNTKVVSTSGDLLKKLNDIS